MGERERESGAHTHKHARAVIVRERRTELAAVHTTALASASAPPPISLPSPLRGRRRSRTTSFTHRSPAAFGNEAQCAADYFLMDAYILFPVRASRLTVGISHEDVAKKRDEEHTLGGGRGDMGPYHHIIPRSYRPTYSHNPDTAPHPRAHTSIPSFVCTTTNHTGAVAAPPPPTSIPDDPPSPVHLTQNSRITQLVGLCCFHRVAAVSVHVSSFEKETCRSGGGGEGEAASNKIQRGDRYRCTRALAHEQDCT